MIKPSKLLPNFQMKVLVNNHNVNNNVEIVVDQSSMVSSCHTPRCPSLATPRKFGLLINLSSYLTQISFNLSKLPPNKPQKITNPFGSDKMLHLSSCKLHFSLVYKNNKQVRNFALFNVHKFLSIM
jgi:hypothetical protein